MENFFLGIIFLIYSFASFSFSTSYMSAYRAFYGLFSTVIEACVVQFDSMGESVPPYFDVGKLNETVGIQLQESLDGKCLYEYKVIGADLVSKKEDPGQNKAVIVSLSCYHWSREAIFSKKAFFSIQEVNHGK